MPSEWAKERALAVVRRAGPVIECNCDIPINYGPLLAAIAAALDEARQSILDRLREPDEALVEAVHRQAFNGPEAICRALADVLVATPPEAPEE